MRPVLPLFPKWVNDLNPGVPIAESPASLGDREDPIQALTVIHLTTLPRNPGLPVYSRVPSVACDSQDPL